jgi:hypothetical protein
MGSSAWQHQPKNTRLLQEVNAHTQGGESGQDYGESIPLEPIGHMFFRSRYLMPIGTYRRRNA